MIKITTQQIASFDIDAQNTFTPVCPNELPVPDGTSIVAELNAQASFAQYRLGSKDAHPANALWVANSEHPVLSPIQADNMDVYWPVHAVPGSLGFELIAGLPKVVEYDFFVWKGVEPNLHPYGACYHDFAERMSTGVIEYLQAKQVQWVIAGGLATDYCVKATVLQLLKAGFKVIVNLGASRGITPQTTTEAISQMQSKGAIIIKSAADLPSLLG